MAKRKKKNSKNSSKILTYTAWALALVAVILSALIAGYYFGYQDAKDDVAKKERLEKQKRLSMLKKLEDAASQKTERPKKRTDVNNRLKEVLKKESKYQVNASHEYDDPSLDKPHPREAAEKVITPQKPKLAIIIDDVSVRSQVNAIKSLGLHLTMSFLPPSKIHPNSAVLASHEKRYMVHLPLEALHFSHNEPNTLRVKDSQEKIFKRIDEIKKMFPKVHYINNHTGSKFTSNEIAMNRLIFALKSHNIYFVDSRTTADTKAPQVMKNFGYKYMARDVFLDHDMEKSAVKKQIKRAVDLAKEYGSAIAIGHPHVNTILALSESKKLFKDVDLVYINQLN